MKMTLRWYGSDLDSVTLKQIRQIPGVTGVISALHDIPAGEVWPYDKIMDLKNQVEAAGLKLEGIESVNVHEDIKLNLPTSKKYIDNYKDTLKNLGKANIDMVCYNFMPVFDWTRSDLAKKIEDGSEVLSYDQEVIDEIDPFKMFEDMEKGSHGFVLPGWELDRMDEIKKLFAYYKDVSEEDLFANFKNFLEQVIPVAEEYGIKMALHPDDPPWNIFGLPRIVTSRENFERVINLVDSPSNGITLCSGSLGSNPENNIPEIIRYFGGKKRIHFAHTRNIKFVGEKKFHESSHLSKDGDFDMYEIMKAYHDVGFEGPMRPDHGRMIWGEVARPGYGLYDRALGATYLNGLWEAIDKA